jgi:hypothetical protein
MNDDELRELQDRVDVIVSMAESAGWAYLVDAARATLLTKQMRIVQGKCDSFEEYKTDCAFGDGMEYLLRLPTRLQASLDDELALRAETVEGER